ncbi:4Fe-4S binding protein, partial [bacterium]|nr:4Fe-4S binding protein [bacterium]
RIASEIARNGCNDLIGIGGVTCAEDAIEYLMIGAGAIGVCSIAILRGIEEFTKLCNNTSVLLAELGYNSISAVKGVALPNFPTGERFGKLEFNYDPDYAPYQSRLQCINCQRCVIACPYSARRLEFPIMSVDRNLCRNCGICVSVCPTGALTAVVVDKLKEEE